MQESCGQFSVRWAYDPALMMTDTVKPRTGYIGIHFLLNLQSGIMGDHISLICLLYCNYITIYTTSPEQFIVVRFIQFSPWTVSLDAEALKSCLFLIILGQMLHRFSFTFDSLLSGYSRLRSEQPTLNLWWDPGWRCGKFAVDRLNGDEKYEFRKDV